MKKSTLLSFATAAAIVVTSAGTFAAWDKMSGTASGTIDFRDPIAVKLPSEPLTFTKTEVVETLPSATTDVAVTLENMPDATALEGYTLKYTAVVKKVSDSEIIDKQFYTSVFSDNKQGELEDGSHNVKVTIKPTDMAGADVLANEITVEVTATLSKDIN